MSAMHPCSFLAHLQAREDYIKDDHIKPWINASSQVWFVSIIHSIDNWLKRQTFYSTSHGEN